MSATIEVVSPFATRQEAIKAMRSIGPVGFVAIEHGRQWWLRLSTEHPENVLRYARSHNPSYEYRQIEE